MVTQERAHEYKSDFFEYINVGSTASARVVCPILIDWVSPESGLDVGCGAGAWCRVWRESGVRDVIGVDGDYVDQTSLLIDAGSFISQDLSKSFDLDRRFDLVVSLEVAEHVAEASAASFVDNLARHGDLVLFSAAVPGQGGEFHVNEQPLDYWRQLFAARGFRCFDPLRPRIAGAREVEPWYRYNCLVYARGGGLARLPAAVLQTEVLPGQTPAEVAPLSWRARNAIIRSLPAPVVAKLVVAKHALKRRLNQKRSV